VCFQVSLLLPLFYISFHLIIFAYMLVLPVIFHPNCFSAFFTLIFTHTYTHPPPTRRISEKGEQVYYGCCISVYVACVFMLTLDFCRVQNDTLQYAFVCYVLLSSMWE